MTDPQTRRRAPRGGLIAAGAALAAGLIIPATAQGALQATGTTLSGRPAAERITIAFTGDRLAAPARQVDTPDPSPGDGRALVRITGRGITTTAPPARRDGVTVRLVRRGPGAIVAVITAPPGRFKFVSYRVSADRRRLVVDLWRATTASRAAIRGDGCLRLTSWRGGTLPRLAGLELEPLFEHTVVTSLRAKNAGGRTIALRPLTATGAVFRPDFSGLRRPGRWSGTLPLPATVTAPQRVMLEAWSTSAKDGSLECLVQVPVVIRPS